MVQSLYVRLIYIVSSICVFVVVFSVLDVKHEQICEHECTHTYTHKNTNEDRNITANKTQNIEFIHLMEHCTGTGEENCTPSYISMPFFVDNMILLNSVAFIRFDAALFVPVHYSCNAFTSILSTSTFGGFRTGQKKDEKTKWTRTHNRFYMHNKLRNISIQRWLRNATNKRTNTHTMYTDNEKTIFTTTKSERKRKAKVGLLCKQKHKWNWMKEVIHFI